MFFVEVIVTNLQEIKEQLLLLLFLLLLLLYFKDIIIIIINVFVEVINLQELQVHTVDCYYH